MSLLTIVTTPSGIAMSADSRTTFIDGKYDEETKTKTENYKSLSDTVVKITTLFDKFAIGTVGEAHLHGYPIEEHFKFFAENVVDKNFNESKNILKQYFEEVSQLKPINLEIIFIGYEDFIPNIWHLDLRNFKFNRELYENGKTVFTLSHIGDSRIVNNLMSNSEILFEKMSLQDAMNFSRHLIITTIEHMKFERSYQTVGGKVDTIVITSDGAKNIFKKELVIEDNY